jgi:hypothetical protein
MRIANKILIATAWAAVLSIAAVCGSVAAAAAADDTKPATTTAAPDAKATTAPAATTTTPATKSTTPSPCKGLDNPTCTANALCSWYKEAKLKDGHTRKAHCQKKPTHVAKPKTAPKTAPKTTPPT